MYSDGSVALTFGGIYRTKQALPIVGVFWEGSLRPGLFGTIYGMKRATLTLFMGYSMRLE